MKTLRDVKNGETVQVTKLNGAGAVKRRIMDMGITKGCSVYVAILLKLPFVVTNYLCVKKMRK